MADQAEQDQKDLRNAYRRVFGSADGELIQANLEEVFGFGVPIMRRSCASDGHVDPIKAGVLEGQQLPCAHIRGMIQK